MTSASHTLTHHLKYPNISLQEYVNQRHAELARELSERRPIYLDTKYWIILRDVVAGSRTSEMEIELLVLLRAQVAKGEAFCPISESTFLELYKQRDPKTRQATALLIDELSLGVSLIPFDKRVLMEIENLIYSYSREMGSPEPQYLPWSKHSYTLGMVHPVNTAFDAKTELAIQKSFFDQMWDMSLVEIVNTIGENLPPGGNTFEALAVKLNIGNTEHAEELRTFPKTYSIEAGGAADVFARHAARVITRLGDKITEQRVSYEGEEWDRCVRDCRGLILGALEKEKGKDELRSLHINTCLHASLRWNKGHQYDGNDFIDFHHAAAALGYCDIFLTERRLKSMVTAKHLQLDRRYSCMVAADIGDALVILRQ